MEIKSIILVGIGGALGSVLRFLTVTYFTRLLPTPFPYGTFIVNIVGCFVIGSIYGLFIRFQSLNTDWRLFLTTGICGGYTTFSAFAYENVKFLEKGNFLIFSLYTMISFFGCLSAVYIGIKLIK